MIQASACKWKRWCGFPGLGLERRCTLSKDSPGRPGLKLPSLWLLLAFCLAAAFFAFDLAMPLGVAAGIPYVALVLTGLYVPARSYTLLTAGASTALVVAGFYLSAEGTVSWAILANRGLAIGAIWTTALLILLLHRRASGQKARKATLQAVMDNLDVAILLTDHSGRIEAANATTNQAFGYSENELTGMPLTELLRPDDRPEAMGILHEPSSPNENPTLRTEDMYGRHKSNRYFPISFSLSSFQLEGQHRYVATAQDITYRRIMEGLNRDAIAKAQSANEMKTAFMARMSHELRTPLNAVKLYTELALDDANAEDQPELCEDLEKVLAAAGHQLDLVNEVLELSTIESKESSRNIKAFAVEALIAEIDEFTAPLARTSHNRVCVVCPPEPGSMTSDQGKIWQIMRALLSNAFKFTESGEVAVIVEPYEEGAAPWIRFVVSDTGIGMTAEETARIFEPFQHANETIARNYSGAGLGLSLCKKFAESLGGRVWITSTKDEGTTAAVELPRHLVPASGHDCPDQANDGHDRAAAVA